MIKFLKIKYPNGRIILNVGGFFSAANGHMINRFLKLAQQYGSEAQREKLLKDLAEAKQELIRLDKEKKGDGVNVAFCKPFSPDPLWVSPRYYATLLKDQAAKLESSIKKIQGMVWGVA